MKKHYLFLFLFCLVVGGAKRINAQISGTNCFMQGRYLEIGEIGNGAFGASGIPAGYHPHLSGTGIPPAGANLAEVYDYGLDGWAVGAPPYMGDYTYPGSPFEGWGLQVNVGRTHAFVPGGFNSAAGGSLTGTIVGYSNTGGRAICRWNGTASAGGMQVRQETRVDTLASWVVVTTVMRNTTAAAMPGVYYLRSCDPDNNQTWAGGGFPTNNQVIYQNDVQHRVLVRATSSTGPASYFGLGTRDCRAKVFIYNSWSMSTAVDFADMYNQTVPAAYGAYYYDFANHPGDIGIGLVYRIGTIAAGDSAIVSYAYTFNNDAGLDQAFPHPQLVVNGTPFPVVAPPAPNYDTFDVCLHPGMTTLPVNINFGSDKNWSWSKWTWSPGTGLATTTGVVNTINVGVLPPIITYTITGTDSAFGMSSCNNKVFYLTILTCNGAVCNSPCEGDTLWFNAPGDSSAATYQWYGPAPSTAVFATTQKAFIYPASAAHNGIFSVIKTVAGVPDTSYTTAVIRHKPNVVASSNAPLCIGTNTLLLTSVVDSPGVTYAWTAFPSSFTSGIANPTISGFSITDTGTYRVIVTSVFGCKDTATTHVTLVPPPAPPIVTALTPYCQGDAFVPFTVTGLVPGGVVLWYSTPVGGTGSTTAPVVNTAVPGLNIYYFSQITGSCESLRDSVKVLVNPVPAPILGTTGVCQYFTTTLTCTTPGGVWSSGNPSVAAIDPVTGVVTGVSGATSGTTATITYTLPTSCRRTTVVTVYGKPTPPGVPEVRYCQYTLANPINAVAGSTLAGSTIKWYGLGVTPALVGINGPIPRTDTAPGVYNYYVTQTSSFGCVSDSATYPVRIIAEPSAPITRDTEYCQGAQSVPLTAIGDSLRWYTSATMPPVGTGSYIAPTPPTVYPGITTHFVTQTINKCESPRAPLNVEILYTPEFEILADRDWVCQFDSLRLKYDGPNPLVNMAFYWQLPIGASFVAGTTNADSIVRVRFDTAWGQHDVVLTVTNYGGKCRGNDTQRIKVVPAPNTHPYMSPDVCVGDTITLALGDRTPNAHSFTWMIDGQPMAISPALKIISANSHSGGPYLISWQDTGRHIIGVQGLTSEGCRALPTADTVNVHSLPDPRFSLLLDASISDKNSKKLCIEDSVLFAANVKDYSCNYKWEPEHYFANENKPVIWGKVEQERSMIKLTVTDPFGCRASYEKKFVTDLCCTVSFPNAFTPNQDSHNDVFRPIFAGYRRFHIFRVSNRWGQTVFESANSNPSWDGMYNGVPQDMGTYYYFIRYDCGGKTLEAKGDITLIR